MPSRLGRGRNSCQLKPSSKRTAAAIMAAPRQDHPAMKFILVRVEPPRPANEDRAGRDDDAMLDDRDPDRSVSVGAEDLAVADRGDGVPCLVVHRALDEPDRDVGEADVDTAGMVRAGGDQATEPGPVTTSTRA